MENGVVEKHLEAAKRAYDNQLAMDAAERERLILEHLPLVRHIAKRVHTGSRPVSCWTI